MELMYHPHLFNDKLLEEFTRWLDNLPKVGTLNGG